MCPAAYVPSTLIVQSKAKTRGSSACQAMGWVFSLPVDRLEKMSDSNGKTGSEFGLSPGYSNFLGSRARDEEEIESADVVLFGAPSDAGTDGRLGASRGPAHVRASSWTFGSFNHALGQDILDGLSVADGGDLEVLAT